MNEPRSNCDRLIRYWFRHGLQVVTESDGSMAVNLNGKGRKIFLKDPGKTPQKNTGKTTLRKPYYHIHLSGAIDDDGTVIKPSSVRFNRVVEYSRSGDAIFGYVVRHKNDNAADNTYDNLKIGTQKENCQDFGRNRREGIRPKGVMQVYQTSAEVSVSENQIS